jgi:homogentisate 1,2-dioxygenase
VPERGPIGANCTANPRDFPTPVAADDGTDGVTHRVVVKECGQFHACEIDQRPLDLVARHGNCAPGEYNLRQSSPVGPVRNDHGDPSIFRVLTAPGGGPGPANMDFAIFPPCRLVAEDSFRPRWNQMSIMSASKGLIEGVCGAKPEGSVRGGMSIHNMMPSLGPDTDALCAASRKKF